MKTSEDPVSIVLTTDCHPAVVWEAITDAAQMREWFFDNIPEFRAEVGFQTEFSVTSGDREFVHLWKVLHVVLEKTLVLQWRYGGFPGDSTVTIEICDQSTGTELSLEHSVQEDFPDSIPEFDREACLGGWRYFIGDQLKSFLRKE